jgi:3'-phosphoadenosine 5'-phosphosulfate sulfotransferase (PAPS reductase)/FAD synthetase
VKHIIQFSGGKDSTALVLWAKEHLPEFTAVFCDTGWEHPLTYTYVDYIKWAVLGGKLTVVKSEKYDGMVDLVSKRKIVPSGRMRFCTEELKVKPFAEWMNQRDEDDCIVYHGIRADESAARGKMPRRMWEPLYEAWIERPLFDWTAEQVFAIHKKHGVPPNPLYKLGHKRVGCFPCVMSSLGELRRISQTTPEVWDRIAEVEAVAQPGSSWFRCDRIPESLQTGRTESGEPYPVWHDVKFYVTRPDEPKLWDDEPAKCLSVYNLCE